MSAKEKRGIIGKDISMIFQNAMSCLNPSFTIEMQLGEVLRKHLGLRGAAVQARILELLELVEMPDAKNRLKVYIHHIVKVFLAHTHQQIVFGDTSIVNQYIYIAK